MNVGDLTVRMAADIADLKTGLDQGRQAISDFGDAASEAFTRLQELVGALAVGELTSWAMEVNNSTAAILEFSHRTGDSVESISQLRDAAALAGKPLDDVTSSLDRLAKNLTAGSAATDKANAALAAFGVSATNTDGTLKQTVDIFNEVAIAQANYADGTAKNADLQLIFSRNASGLIETMNQLVATQGAAISVTTEEATAALTLQTAYNALHLDLTHLAEGLVGELAPAFTALLVSIHDSITANGDLSQSMRDTVGTIGPLLQAFNDISNSPASSWSVFAAQRVGDLIDVLKLLVSAVLEIPASFASVGATVLDVIGSIIQGWALLLQDIPILGTTLQTVADKFQVWRDGALSFTGAVDASFQSAAGSMGNYAAQVSIGTLVQQALNGTFDDARDKASKYADALPQVTVAHVAAAASAADFTSAINSLQQQLDKLTGADGGFPNFEKAVDAVTKAQADGKTVTDSQVASYLALAGELDIATAQAKTYKDAMADLNAQANAQSSAINAIQKAYQNFDQELANDVATIDRETASIGLDSAAKKQLAADQQIDTQLRKTINQLTADGTKALSDEAQATVVAAQADADAAKVAVAASIAKQQAVLDWYNVALQANQGLATSLVDIWDHGTQGIKDMWDNFLKWGEEALAQIAAKQIIVSIVGALSIGGAAGSQAANAVQLGSQGQGLSTLLGAGGSGMNLFGAASNLFGGLGGGVSDMALSAMLSPALSGITSGLGLTTAAADTIAAASMEIGAGTAAVGASLTSLGATVLAAVPVVGWAIAAAAVAYELLAQKPGGPKQGGAFSDGIAGFNTYPGETSAANDSQMQTAAMGVLNTLATINTALGSTAYGQYKYGLSYDTDPQGTAQDRVSSELMTGAQVSYNQRDVNAGRDSTSLQAQMTDQMQAAIIAGINATNLAQPFKDLFNQIDTTLSSTDFSAAIQQIVNFKVALDAFADQGLAQRFEQAADINPAAISSLTQFALAYTAVETALGVDPQAAAMQQVANANTTAYGAVLKLRDGLSSLVSTYDGSTAATNNLAAATAQYVAAQVQALVQIEQLKSSLSGLFGDSIRQIQLATMTPDQQESFYLTEAANLQTQLSTAIDPATINSLSTLINTDLTTAFGLLSPADQLTQQNWFIGQLTATNATAQTQLKAATDSITQANTTQQNILTTIQDAINTAANNMITASTSMTASATSAASASDVMSQAANTMASAGDTFKAAADEGVQVAVTFTANVPGDSQTNFGGGSGG